MFVAGDRIGLVTTQGGLYARDRRDEWVAVASGVAAFQLEGNRIAALQDDGTLRVKEGVHGPWTAVASRVFRFQLEGNRIGILQRDENARRDDDADDDDDDDGGKAAELGTLFVKEGSHGAWSALAERVTAFQLEGNRIATLQRPGGHPDDDDDKDDDDRVTPANSTLLVKEGIHGPWTAVAGGVRHFQLEGNRIGALLYGKNGGGDDDDDDGDNIGHLRMPPGRLRLKEGIHGLWTDVATRVSGFQLEGNRVGAIHRDGTVRVKDGIHSPWTTLATDALDLQLQENAIGVLANDGLYLREGIQGAWKPLRTSFAGASRFRLLVDVPLVFRIRPPTYNVQAARCDGQYAEGEDADGKHKCYPTYATRSIRHGVRGLAGAAKNLGEIADEPAVRSHGPRRYSTAASWQGNGHAERGRGGQHCPFAVEDGDPSPPHVVCSEGIAEHPEPRNPAGPAASPADAADERPGRAVDADLELRPFQHIQPAVAVEVHSDYAGEAYVRIFDAAEPEPGLHSQDGQGIDIDLAA